jgi:3-oxoadipate enol-lactonase
LFPLVRVLSKRFRVLVPDLPGYGTSWSMAGRYSFEGAQRLLEEALMKRGVRRAGVIGFSTGAYRALLLAVARGPIEVPVVLGLAGFACVPDELRPEYERAAERIRSGEALGEELASTFFSPDYYDAHPEAVAEVERWPDAAGRGVLAGELEALARSIDLRPQLERVPARVILRVGELDVMAPPERSAEIAASVPGATIDVIPNAGHALMFEDPIGCIEAARRAMSILRG